MSPNRFKNLPGFVKILIRPTLYLSLALHGLLLMMPIASETAAKSSPKKKESVKITQLPSLPSPKPSSVVPVPKPTTVVQQNPISPIRAPLKTPPARLNDIIESPQPFPIVQQNFATPTAMASPTPTPTPTVMASPTPPPTPTAMASPTPTPTSTQNELVAGVANFENAQRSCSGFCWQIEGISARIVSASSKDKFEAQGYTVDEQNIEDDTGRSVYKISKNGKTQYFNVLSTVNGGTVYLITERLLTREELAQKAAL